MEDVPKTRQSLLLRIRDGQDARAWSEFVAIYEPLVYRLVRKKGFQHADALELTQEVLFAVSKSIDRWDADPANDESAEFDWEYRRRLFRWAAERVQAEFRPATWQAFWRTCVDGHSVKLVAQELKLSVGAVYVARSRVMARLRTYVEEVRES